MSVLNLRVFPRPTVPAQAHHTKEGLAENAAGHLGSAFATVDKNDGSFSCLVGTIFENTKLPLVKWFVAMYLISSHKKGISSHQLSRDIDVTQTTAWYMLQKIRLLYQQSDAEAFQDTVECDEVYYHRPG